MKIIRSDECNEAIKGYFKSLIDKGQQDVDVVNASAELIDIINEIPPAGLLMNVPDENDTFFEDFDNAHRKADVPEMQKQMISIAEDEERFIAVYEESVKMFNLIMNEIEAYRAIGTIEECRAAVEKQVAKKPVDKIMFLECPNCGDVGILDCLYCSCCGQKLDWQ